MTNVARFGLISTAAFSLALAGTMAPAQASPTSRAGAQVQGQNQAQDQNRSRNSNSARSICAVFEISGTRLRQKICRTAAEWEREGGIPGKN